MAFSEDHAHHTHHHGPDDSQLFNAHDLSDAVEDIANEDHWEPVPPQPSMLSDHGVTGLSDILANRRIALLVCGGIAAMKAPLLARELRKHGAEVVAFVSQEALRYVTVDALAWSTNNPVIQTLSTRAEHLGDGQPFDAYLLAPATYNTLNKFALGIADTLITTVLASALGRVTQHQCAILVAPTMHGSMHTPILVEHLNRLQQWGVKVIPPRDAYGKHNLPDFDLMIYLLARELGGRPLSGLSVLVTGGPTPVPLDDIRYLTNRFTGRLSYAIARAFYLAGAQVHWVLGASHFTPPAWLPCYGVHNFDEYVETVRYLAAEHACQVGVFSAAVADYALSTPYAGKYPSGEAWSLNLTKTHKVIEDMHKQFPEMYKVSFKLESGIPHDELLKIARQRLQKHSQLVVANQVSDQDIQANGHGNDPGDFATRAPQTAWLVSEHSAHPFVGKAAIAQGIVDHVKAAYFNTME
jgi:phosphopantothenoylcysteine decarboxylase / phosphopantothenate---cysteine ligase